MRAVKVLCTVMCAVGLFCTVAADPGARDSLIIGSNSTDANTIDTVKVGQSTPIPIRIVNDEFLTAIDLPFRIKSIDGGFVRVDSIVWRDRASQPTVLPYRVFNTMNVDGNDTDSLLIALVMSAPPSFQFGAGSDILGDLFVTGILEGSVAIDSGYYPPVHDSLVFLEQTGPGSYTYISPEFDMGRIQVVEGDLPPVLSLPNELPAGHIGSQISFDVSATSPESRDCTIDVVGVTAWDDAGDSPFSQPSASSGNPATITWTPTLAPDVGIWRVKVRACDTQGFCTVREIMVQVVQTSSQNIDFMVSEFADADFLVTLKHGNADTDSDPELLGVGSPFHDWSMSVVTYDFTAPNAVNRLFDYNDHHPKRSMETGYIGSDNFLDMVVVGFEGGAAGDQITVFEGDSSGSFTAHLDSDPLNLVRSTAIGNFNGDAYLDVALGGRSGVQICTGTSGLDFVVALSFFPGDSVNSINATDFDGDGYDDLAIGTPDWLKVYINDGAGGFSEAASYAQNHMPFDIQITNGGADFNNDDVFDLVTTAPSTDAGASELYLYLGNGDGTFTQSLIRTVEGQTIAILPGDFDGDGNLDAAYSNAAGNTIGILYGDGSGAFTCERRYAVPKYNPRAIDCLDFDSDGDLDLVVNSFYGEYDASIFVFENQTDPPGFAATSVEIRGLDNANISLHSASGKVLNRVRNTMASGMYYDRNLNQNSVIDRSLHLGVVEDGAYSIEVAPTSGGTKSGDFSLEFDLNGTAHRIASHQQIGTGTLNFAFYPSHSSEVLPRPGTFTYFLKPTFFWPGAGNFDFELATDPMFSNVLITTTVSGNSYVPASNLAVVDTATYYWHVRPTGSPEFGDIFVVNLLNGSLEPGCGNIDNDPSDDVTISDLTYLIAYMFRSGPPPAVLGSANVNGVPGIDIADVTTLVGYMFKGGIPLVCPDL